MHCKCVSYQRQHEVMLYGNNDAKQTYKGIVSRLYGEWSLPV